MTKDREVGKWQESLWVVAGPQVLQDEHERAKWKGRQSQTGGEWVSFKCKLGFCRYQDRVDPNTMIPA